MQSPNASAVFLFACRLKDIAYRITVARG